MPHELIAEYKLPESQSASLICELVVARYQELDTANRDLETARIENPSLACAILGTLSDCLALSEATDGGSAIQITYKIRSAITGFVDAVEKPTGTIWGVFQHTGSANEKLISIWSSYDEAWCAMSESFTEAERDELSVDVMVNRNDGDWTTEY